MASAKPGGADALLPFPDSGVDGGGEMVTIAGSPDHRHEPEVVELPTEQPRIEPDGCRRVAGVQVAEVPTAGCVGELGAQPPSWLPQAEACAPRIDAARPPTARTGVDGPQSDGATGRTHGGRRSVGVGRRDAGVPLNWRIALRRPDRRHLGAVKGSDQV